MKDLNELIKKINEDNDFAKELAKAESKEEFLEKLKQKGYELTDEAKSNLLKVIGEKELTDDELENVAGGMASRYDIMLLRTKVEGLNLKTR